MEDRNNNHIGQANEKVNSSLKSDQNGKKNQSMILDQKNNYDLSDQYVQIPKFEDLPYNPNIVMDKIEQFWICLTFFCEQHKRCIKLLSIAICAILYNSYFAWALVHFVKSQVSESVCFSNADLFVFWRARDQIVNI